MFPQHDLFRFNIGLAVSKYKCALDDVAQLAHVSWPVVRGEFCHGLRV